MFSALVTLAFAGIPVVAHGQPAPDIDWASVLSADTDPRVQVTTCGSDVCVRILGSPPPNSGVAALDQVTYGDIGGDGGTEAVVPIDSGGSIGVIGSLIYMLGDSGAPQLVLADGPSGKVFIDPIANDRGVARVVQRWAERAGLDPERFAGHSLRTGLATSAAAGGVSERAIMNQTGHSQPGDGPSVHP